MSGRVAGQYEKYGPFGDWGDHVGQCSIIVLDALLEEVPTDVRVDGKLTVLSKNDSRVFEELVDLEGGIECIRPDSSVEASTARDLHRAFRRFHTSLPLSEAERHWWLHGASDRQTSRVDPCQPDSLLGVAEEVTSGGLRQVIQGRELVRRMGAWRRQTDEFAGQGTLEEARQALGDIATTLVTEANWPSEHEALRQQLRA